MSCCGAPINDGLRFMLDQQQRFVQAGPPVYIVIQNYGDVDEVNEAAEELGFAVTVGPSGQGGTTPILIDPPPTVKNMSLHNIGQAAQAGIRVSAGSKVLTISHTFVLQQMALRNLDTAKKVFEDVTTVGLLIEGSLMSIESSVSNDAFGQPISWKVIGTAAEGG